MQTRYECFKKPFGAKSDQWSSAWIGHACGPRNRKGYTYGHQSRQAAEDHLATLFDPTTHDGIIVERRYPADKPLPRTR
ncbi:MAG: hypothetical protein OXE45_09375 [bacterium]|nr:hypothetical protein [bacterium]